MVGVFAIFATLSALEIKQLGVGLAAAILIDATIIRAVVLPAVMTLLGGGTGGRRPYCAAGNRCPTPLLVPSWASDLRIRTRDSP